MPTLFRDLQGGYLVPYLNAKPNELWQSSNTANTNVQLSRTPVISGNNSVLISPGLTTVTNLLDNGSFETVGYNWSKMGLGIGPPSNNAFGSVASGQGYIGTKAGLIALPTNSNSGVGAQTYDSMPAGTYTFQVAFKLGSTPPPNTWKIGVGLAQTNQFNTITVTPTSNYQIFSVTTTTTVAGIVHAWITYNGSGTAYATAAYFDAAVLYAGDLAQQISYVDNYTHGLILASGTSDSVSTPHQAGLVAGTSTIEIRAQVTFADWSAIPNCHIVSKGTASQRYWLGFAGSKLTASWVNTANVAQTVTTATSFASLGITAGTYWVGCQLFVGSGQANLTWGTDPNNMSTIGTTFTGLTTTAVSVTGTEPALFVGGPDTFYTGVVQDTQVIIGASTIINQNWNAVPAGNGPWTNPTTGEVWTRSGSATVNLGTNATQYVNNVAYSPVMTNLTDYDGVGMFMFTPNPENLDHVRVRLYTEDPTTSYPSYFEINVMLSGVTSTGGVTTLYGTGLYTTSVYSVLSGATTVTWNEIIVPKENFISVGTPSWAKITRTEITPFMLAGRLANVYVDAVSGWVNPAPEEASANRIMNRLPNFYWDTDYYRQLCQELGYELDVLKATTRFGLDQRFISKAQWGLRLWEQQFQLPIEPVGDLEKRRAVAKMLFAQPASKAEFIQYLSGIADSGVQITELYAQYIVMVNAGVNSTQARNQLVLALSRTIPAHLQVAVTYTAFVAGVGLAGSGLGPSYFQGTGESASFADSAVKTP